MERKKQTEADRRTATKIYYASLSYIRASRNIVLYAALILNAFGRTYVYTGRAYTRIQSNVV